MQSTISSYYLSNMLARVVGQTQTQLGVAQSQLSSGAYQDPGMQLGALSGLDASLKNQNSRLQSLIDANGLLSGGIGASQNAIDAIRAAGQSVLQQVAAWTPANNSPTLSGIGASGAASLASAANTAWNGQFVFGGINSGAPPFNDYSSPGSPARSAVVAAFTAQFGFSPADPAAASITPDAMQSFLDNGFSQLFAGSGWSANWSSASNENAYADIAPGRSAAISTNANEAAFRDFAKASAMLQEFGSTALSDAARSTVAENAVKSMATSIKEFTDLEAGLGATQSAISGATDSMKQQSALLQSQVGKFDQADPYAAATTINMLTTRLQSAYQLTARLQQLSLVAFLPA